MFDLNNIFKGAFGKIEPGYCKLSANGNIAVRCSDGSYKSYNMKKKRLVDISNFGFNADNMFFVIPTNSVKVGDIILVPAENGKSKPKCVIGINGDDSIRVIDYDSSEVREIVPVRHVFMGATYFYGKIVSLFGNVFKSGKGMNKLMSTLAMMSMFGGNSGKGGFGTNNGGFDPMMFMLMSNGGGFNMFEDMFADMDLDFVKNAVDDDDEIDDDDAEEEAPKAKRRKKTITEEDE